MKKKVLLSMLLSYLLCTVIAPAVPRTAYATPQAAPAYQLDIVTVGSFIALGKLVGSWVDDRVEKLRAELVGAVDEAKSAALEILEDFRTQLTAVIDKLTYNYGRALDMTLDKLDASLARQLGRLYGVLNDLNTKLRQDIELLRQSALDILKQATEDMQQTIEQIQKTLAFTIGGLVYLIDAAVFAGIFFIVVIAFFVFIIAVTILLLVKGGSWTPFQRRGLLVVAAIYTAVSALLVWPTGRAWAISAAGQAHTIKMPEVDPRISSVTPSTVTIGHDTVLILSGAHFTTADAAVAPVVIVGPHVITATQWTDNYISLNLAGTGADLPGEQRVSVKIKSEGRTRESNTWPITFAQPAVPREIVSWRIVPSGNQWIYASKGPLRVECTYDWNVGNDQRKPVTPDPDNQVLLDPGWALNMDKVSEDWHFSGLPGARPETHRGFFELTAVDDFVIRDSQGQRLGKNQFPQIYKYAIEQKIAWRDITYAGNGAGLRITGACPKFNYGLTRLSTEWTDYFYIYGKKQDFRTGNERKGEHCVTAGSQVCDTYPADQLTMFVDNTPELYNVELTFRNPDGTLENHVGQLYPKQPEKRMTSSDGQVNVWIENNQLRVLGPAEPTPVPIPTLDVNLPSHLTGPELPGEDPFDAIINGR